MGDSDTWCRYWGMAIGIIGRRHTTCHIDGTYLLIETKVSLWQDVWKKKCYVLEKKIFNWLLTPSYHFLSSIHVICKAFFPRKAPQVVQFQTSLNTTRFANEVDPDEISIYSFICFVTYGNHIHAHSTPL